MPNTSRARRSSALLSDLTQRASSTSNGKRRGASPDQQLERAKVVTTEGCWLYRRADRYGMVYHGRLDGRRWIQEAAHRYAYRTMVGPIPDGYDIDHLCRVKGCFNPDHLEPVTHRENIVRGESPIAGNAKRALCPKGHEYVWVSYKNRPPHRVCRECAKQTTRKWRAARAV